MKVTAKNVLQRLINQKMIAIEAESLANTPSETSFAIYSLPFRLFIQKTFIDKLCVRHLKN